MRNATEADAEYRHAGRWYEGRRTGLGLEFFDAVDAALSQVVDLPDSGTLVPRVAPGPAGPTNPREAYSLPRSYLETDARIRVLAVAHDRRKPGYWKSRL